MDNRSKSAVGRPPSKLEVVSPGMISYCFPKPDATVAMSRLPVHPAKNHEVFRIEPNAEWCQLWLAL